MTMKPKVYGNIGNQTIFRLPEGVIGNALGPIKQLTAPGNQNRLSASNLDLASQKQTKAAVGTAHGHAIVLWTAKIVYAAGKAAQNRQTVLPETGKRMHGFLLKGANSKVL